jgi:hypothetical protein
MDFGNSKMSPYAQLIQHGLAMANRRLLETDAALGRPLILGHQDGTFEEKNAREFLNEAMTSEWWKIHFEENKEVAPEDIETQKD